MPSKAKDMNAQLQDWQAKNVEPDKQARYVEAWLKSAKPYIVVWAEEIGEIQNLNEKSDALNDFFKNGVAILSPEDRAGFKDILCASANIKSTQWTERLKSLNGLVKKNKKDEDDDEPVFHTGGWLFDYFLGLEYDPEQDKTFFAVRRPDGSVEDRVEKIKIQDVKYMPIPVNNIIRKQSHFAAIGDDGAPGGGRAAVCDQGPQRTVF